MVTEIWRPVVNYEGWYEVSNLGRVRSLNRVIIRRNGVKYRAKGRILRPQRHLPSWVLSVTLARRGDRQQACVHKLVEAAFSDHEENAA